MPQLQKPKQITGSKQTITKKRARNRLVSKQKPIYPHRRKESPKGGSDI